MNKIACLLSQFTLVWAVFVPSAVYGQVIDQTSVDIVIGNAKPITEKDSKTDEEKVIGYEVKVSYKNLTAYGITASAVVHVSDIPERNDPLSGLAYVLSNIRDAGGQGKLTYKDDKIRLKPKEVLSRTYFFEIKWRPNNKQSKVSLSNFERSRILEKLR